MERVHLISNGLGPVKLRFLSSCLQRELIENNLSTRAGTSHSFPEAR